MTVRVFGVRHHGPGSARALGSSLRAWAPDAVLIEGPPEAGPVLPLAGSDAMVPPVALLGYRPAQPERYSFYPMASWSPEWVAIRHALSTGAALSMIDLPVAAFLEPDDGAPAPYDGDPLAQLAGAAGYDDTERWWEDMIEHRGSEEPWEAVTEAMAELRAGWSPEGREARREASMRRHIRAAARRHARVAVVCGAWHAPAMVDMPTARSDQELLRPARREKATVTWVPWTHDRLSSASGYGAGVSSPGWYEHLYASPDRPIERWMVKVAGLLRAEQLDAPPSAVIDAVRLAEAIAAMRERPLAGLAECTDAARATLSGGYDSALALIESRLVVGEVIGAVPPETPMVPLAADLAAQQRRLRLKPVPTARWLELDLRRDLDLQRSRLLHRLCLLSIPWGVAVAESRGTGTFREEWNLAWSPDLAVRVIEASVHGTTVEAAATHRAVEELTGARTVSEVTALVEACLLADLSEAVPALMAGLDERAAVASDVAELLDALPPLARVLRYGTVRRTDAGALERVVRGLVSRACVSLAPGCASLDDDAAAAMTQRISATSSALGSLDLADLRREWLEALGRVARSGGGHGLVAGRCWRILLDAGVEAAGTVAVHLAAALSPGESPGRAARWVEGLVGGSGLLLVHDPELLGVIDGWLAGVTDGAFDDVLPLLRRAFSDFEPGERRLIGESVTRLGDADGADRPVAGAGRGSEPGPGGATVTPNDFDEARAAAVLPLLELLLGEER